MLNALAESLLDEAEDLDPVAEICLDALRGQPVGGQKRLPAGVAGAVAMHAGGKLLAKLGGAGADFVLRGLDGLDVFLADLLLDQGAADQLLERPLPGERAVTPGVGIEDGEADLVVEVA